MVILPLRVNSQNISRHSQLFDCIRHFLISLHQLYFFIVIFRSSRVPLFRKTTLQLDTVFPNETNGLKLLLLKVLSHRALNPSRHDRRNWNGKCRPVHGPIVLTLMHLIVCTLMNLVQQHSVDLIQLSVITRTCTCHCCRWPVPFIDDASQLRPLFSRLICPCFCPFRLFEFWHFTLPLEISITLSLTLSLSLCEHSLTHPHPHIRWPNFSTVFPLPPTIISPTCLSKPSLPPLCLSDIHLFALFLPPSNRPPLHLHLLQRRFIPILGRIRFALSNLFHDPIRPRPHFTLQSTIPRNRPISVVSSHIPPPPFLPELCHHLPPLLI